MATQVWETAAWVGLTRRVAAGRPLLRTAVRGGVLRLTASALTYGEGMLGSRNQRSFAVAAIERLEVVANQAARGVSLRIATASGEELRCEGVSPAAAMRLRELVIILRGERS